MWLFYRYATAKSEIQICSNYDYVTGLVLVKYYQKQWLLWGQYFGYISLFLHSISLVLKNVCQLLLLFFFITKLSQFIKIRSLIWLFAFDATFTKIKIIKTKFNSNVNAICTVLTIKKSVPRDHSFRSSLDKPRDPTWWSSGQMPPSNSWYIFVLWNTLLNKR